MSLGLQLYEEAISPAAERPVGHRCSNANVDTNITSICFISILPGSRSATRKKTCHISVRLRVDQLNRILNRIYMHQTKQGTKYLRFGKRRVGRDLIHDSGVDPVPICVVLHFLSAAVDTSLPSFIFSCLIKLLHTLAAIRCDYGTYFGSFIRP